MPCTAWKIHAPSRCAGSSVDRDRKQKQKLLAAAKAEAAAAGGGGVKKATVDADYKKKKRRQPLSEEALANRRAAAQKASMFTYLLRFQQPQPSETWATCAPRLSDV